MQGWDRVTRIHLFLIRAGGEFWTHFLCFLTSIWQRKNGKWEGNERELRHRSWRTCWVLDMFDFSVILWKALRDFFMGQEAFQFLSVSHSRHCLDVSQYCVLGAPLGTWESRCHGQRTKKEHQNDCAPSDPLLCCPWCLLVLQKDIPLLSRDATFLRMSRCCGIPARGQWW